jgi:hypothetical protein
LAPLRRQRDRGEADRRRAKPYNIVHDISTHGSGQWLGGGYIVKANPREVLGDVVGIIRRQGKSAMSGDFTDRASIDRKEEK